MMRSMFSAITALRNHQTFMDVVGNNIANVNTVAYKGTRVLFQDMLSQTLRAAAAPQGNRGGLNPMQIGLGMGLAGLDTLNTQGNLQSTGKMTDMAIQGDGYFILGDGNRNFYTRDGGMDLATDGTLVHQATGMRVLGWTASATGVVDTTQPIGAINIPLGQMRAGQATSTAALAGNLDATTATGGTIATTIQVYDSLGDAHTIKLTFTKNAAANQWDWAASSTDTAITGVTGNGTLTFTGAGAYSAGSPGNISIAYNNGAVSPQAISVDFTALTQFADTGAVSLSRQDGSPAGTLTAFNVSGTGEITGVYSNGLNIVLGQVALATFPNPGGLTRTGRNLLGVTPNSGAPMIGTGGTGNRGTIATGQLEMSNVNLADEFTNMIVAERGFQANSRVISVSDEMLQELVNLKR